jgi:hypothetical protein
MPRFEDEDVARMIADLPPAPTAWVQSAQALPAARAALDDLLERAQAHARERRAILADLESALREAGVEPLPVLVEELRRRLAD